MHRVTPSISCTRESVLQLLTHAFYYLVSTILRISQPITEQLTRLPASL
jgi:hypothetical protein